MTRRTLFAALGAAIVGWRIVPQFAPQELSITPHLDRAFARALSHEATIINSLMDDIYLGDIPFPFEQVALSPLPRFLANVVQPPTTFEEAA